MDDIPPTSAGSELPGGEKSALSATLSMDPPPALMASAAEETSTALISRPERPIRKKTHMVLYSQGIGNRPQHARHARAMQSIVVGTFACADGELYNSNPWIVFARQHMNYK